MDPLLDSNPAEFWRRFRAKKSLAELATEQGTKIPNSFDGYLADIMPEGETPEIWNTWIDGWREEDRRRANA